MSLFTPVHMSNAFANINASRRVVKEFTDVILNEIGTFLYLIQVRAVFFSQSLILKSHVLLSVIENCYGSSQQVWVCVLQTLLVFICDEKLIDY